MFWRSVVNVCKNVQLNDCLVAHQLKQMVFVKSKLGFIGVQLVQMCILWI